MKTNFDKEFFESNRKRLRELFTGTAPIIITAHGQLQRNADGAYPFRQDASFWYLTGLNEPDLILVLDKTKEYIITPNLSDYQRVFDGGLSVDQIITTSGVKNVLSAKEGWQLLKSKLSRVKHVATLAANASYVESLGIYSNPARSKLISRINDLNPDIELLDLREHLSRMRMIKQPAEVQAIKNAVNLTEQALIKVHKNISKYKFEYEIEADITSEFIKHGSQPAWKPIVGSGINSCLLHYNANNKQLVRDDLVVIDVGAEVDGYAADITRTWAVSEELTARQRKVYMSVLEVQEYALQLLKPGLDLKKYEKKIEHFMGEKLRSLGLIKVINKDNVRKYFPHATSHFLGLDAHDAGDYDRPLKAGVILTVEPGIYITEEAIGIRIEDDVLITEDGYKSLSNLSHRQL